MVKDKTIEKCPTSTFKVKSSTIRMINVKPSISRGTQESFLILNIFIVLLLTKKNKILTMLFLPCKN